MISKLEKTTSVLFATLIALSTPNCGGGGGGGSGDNDAGNDVTATEETTGPECYSHAECGDDYICVEGDCESIDQACALRPNAECDENSRFEGIYAITSSTCPLILEGTSFSYIVFDDNQDCRFVNVLGLTNIGSEPVCLESEFEGPRPTGNFLMTSGTETLEFRKCSPDTVLLNWNNYNCQAILDFYQENSLQPPSCGDF